VRTTGGAPGLQARAEEQPTPRYADGAHPPSPGFGEASGATRPTNWLQAQEESTPRYALRKGAMGAWELIFEGQRATLKPELGIEYVAFLLANPPEEPLPGLVLAMRVDPPSRAEPCATEIEDPVSGAMVVVGRDAIVQERSLALDDGEVLQGLWREQRKLEAILEDRGVSETIKAEVRQDLEAIHEFKEKNRWRSKDNTIKTANSVGRAVMRFYQQLANATDYSGAPCPVLRAFAAHLKNHLLIPSGRSGPRGGDRCTAPAGCFTYLRPEGVVWAR